MQIYENHLSEIANWDVDAAREDMERYFFQSPSLDPVINEKRNLVIGRKGSGKTAIFEYIRSKESYNNIVIPLSFSNFQFSLLYKLRDKNMTGTAWYVTLWKYIIFSQVCGYMAYDPRIRYNLFARLRSRFPKFTDKKIDTFIPEPKAGALKVKIGELIEFNSDTGDSSEISDWQSAVDALEDAIQEYSGEIRFTIMFDAMDDDYRNMITTKNNETTYRLDYFALIIGLLKAVYYISGLRRKNSAYPIHPVAFISDDIFRLLDDRDKTKWNSMSHTLRWSKADIKDFLAFRISRAITNSELFTFDKAWLLVMENHPVRFGRDGENKSIFDYIIFRTLQRPRDFIRYMQISSEYSNRIKAARISPEIISGSEDIYSDQFLGEMIDEMSPIIPDIRRYFEIIAKIKNHRFFFDTFNKIYEEVRSDGLLRFSDNISAKTALIELYENSAIGNINENIRYRVFKYTTPNVPIDFHSELIVHSGLFRALRLTARGIGNRRTHAISSEFETPEMESGTTSNEAQDDTSGI